MRVLIYLSIHLLPILCTPYSVLCSLVDRLSKITENISFTLRLDMSTDCFFILLSFFFLNFFLSEQPNPIHVCICNDDCSNCLSTTISVCQFLDFLNPFPAEPGYILPSEANWSDLHCLSFSMWICINNLDQVIWLADNLKWECYLILFSMTRVKILNTEVMQSRVLTRILKIGVKCCHPEKAGVLPNFSIETFQKVGVRKEKLE